MRLLSSFVLLIFLVFAAQAADKQKSDPLPEPPAPVKNYKSPPQPPVNVSNDAGELPEPEVVITTKGEDRHEEYRIAGRLYMIKVVPKIGRPYYLIDNEGKGEFAKHDFQPSVNPPMWVIKRF